MADLTPKRRPVLGQDAARHIKIRRMELDVQVLKTDMLRWEIEILDFEEQIGRRQASIEVNEAKIREVEQLLDNLRGEAPPEGGTDG